MDSDFSNWDFGQPRPKKSKPETSPESPEPEENPTTVGGNPTDTDPTDTDTKASGEDSAEGTQRENEENEPEDGWKMLSQRKPKPRRLEDAGQAQEPAVGNRKPKNLPETPKPEENFEETLSYKPAQREPKNIDAALWWKTLMATVSEKKVTDIIFSPESKDAYIRVNTELELYQRIGKENYDALIYFQVPEGRREDLGRDGEVDFAVTCFTRRMRVNVFKSLKGLSAAFRPLPNKSIPWRENGLTSQMMHIIDTTKQGLVLVTGPTGSGKCLGYGTPVLKHDGSVVPVESLKPGDLLMGPDGNPRKILVTNPGTGPLYKIIPENKEWNPWVCNDSHIMTLVRDAAPANPALIAHSEAPLAGRPASDIVLQTLLEATNPEDSGWLLVKHNPHTKELQTSKWRTEPLGAGAYFGILLDGDGRFLLGDFTVTHNSTTLCSMLEYINEKHPYHIITIEDPVEYIFTNRKSVIQQREVGEHTNGFQQALRASLRENPDIIFVGEMRDYETARTALMAADTGHLVFGTLHTRRVYTTISRLLEMAPESSRPEMRAMLSNSLAMVLCQRLLHRRGGGIWPCREVMMLNPAISSLIKEGKEKGISNQLTINQAKGMCEWGKALDNAVQQGVITEDEAEKYRDNTEEID